MLSACHDCGRPASGKRCTSCAAAARAAMSTARQRAPKRADRSSKRGRWARVRRAVLERDGYVCHWCSNEATEVDHLDPVSQGGAVVPEDRGRLVAACARCNRSRGARDGAPRGAREASAGPLSRGGGPGSGSDVRTVAVARAREENRSTGPDFEGPRTGSRAQEAGR